MGIKDNLRSIIHPPKPSNDLDENINYFIPGALVTTLFFLWGFSYGLLDTLNKHFQTALGLSKKQNNESVDICNNLFNLQLPPRRRTCKCRTSVPISS